MDDMVKLEMPPHAVWMLVSLVKWGRTEAVKRTKGLTLQGVSLFDSLEAIENSIPAEYWRDEHDHP